MTHHHSSKAIRQYIEDQEHRFLEELYSLLRIPSVSSQSEHRPDMEKCADRWRELLLESGFESAEIYRTKGHPVVFAEKRYNEEAPTVLVYGHYDVMPSEPLEEWKSAPFEPEIRDGLLYGRGTDDDKGQTMTQVKGFEIADRLGLLRCNVKVVLEGEEEIGSVNLKDFCKEYRDLLKCDLILVSDTSMIATDIPSVTVGLRGICYWELEVKGPNRDLHSGKFGGAVTNPLNALCQIIADLQDAEGRITIPGFYDDVVPLDPKEREMMARIPFDEEEFRRDLGVSDLSGEAGYTTMERKSGRPTLDVCGIYGGYTGEGAKTILPSKATAKVSSRIVANQDYKKIQRAFTDYVKAIAPSGVTVTVRELEGGSPYLFDIHHPAYRVAEEAMEAAFGVKPLATRSGGSIPIISTLEEVLGAKSILLGFGLNSDNIHSPNESFPLECFRKGIETVAEFYARFNHE
ncbi:MAG: dipeptidase [Bacteroidales bacterium]|nr:dipeptidase [Bacteroidales bacterium]